MYVLCDYIGYSYDPWVHIFSLRQIMFYGHPVETLCTYQYSLVSLVPGRLVPIHRSIVHFLRATHIHLGLLQTLDDCGSPPLTTRIMSLSRATSLRTSDRRSLLAYLGLPLDIFGKVNIAPVVWSVAICFLICLLLNLLSAHPCCRMHSFSHICRYSRWTWPRRRDLGFVGALIQ